jgi:beta-lactamase superfamily II metal-dependent hydrolase
MARKATTIDVRMYNVGFGDAFRVTVRDGQDTWRMLVDCGVHSHGQARPMDESVQNVIADLVEDCGGKPHLDVVVATHHHQDHISGFAEDDWASVEVSEVWVPFVENDEDDDAVELKRVHSIAAMKLEAMIATRLSRLAADDSAAANMLDDALAFAVNSRGNEKATNRLLSRNNTTFANEPHVRYLPSRFRAQNIIEADKCGVVAHILGPPRDPDMIKKMHPPARAGWLTLNLDDDEIGDDGGDEWALFSPGYIVADNAQVPAELIGAQKAMDLDSLTNDVGLLTAASILERSVNNTSLFFVLDVRGVRFLFPGDAQHGAWEHVRTNPAAKKLISSVDFYKVGHHGSHNATPKPFVLEDWKIPGDAMVPWGMVKRWKDTIPKQELIEALTVNHRVILPGEVKRGPGSPHAAKKVKRTKWWSELTFTVPS